jgi:hypothetical protein
MSFESINVSLEDAGTIKAEEGKWNEACENELNSETSSFLDSKITPSALQKILGHSKMLSHLSKVLTQQLCHTPLYEYDRKTEEFLRTTDKKKRNDVSDTLNEIKNIVQVNMITQKIHSSGQMQASVNDYKALSFILMDTVKKMNLNYTIIQKTVKLDNPNHRDACLFYHKKLKQCALIVIPKDVKNVMKNVHQFLSKNALLLSMNNICAQCGRCSNDLMDCSDCKATRYCNSECQSLHWDGHKVICKRRKAVLEERKKKLRAMSQRLIRRCMKNWKSRHSFPVRPESGDRTECVEETGACELESSPPPDMSMIALGNPANGAVESLLRPVMSMVALGRSENHSDQEAGGADSDGAESVG